ncbi:MAG: CoA-binding protein, partial [Thermodesulfobacteriota bacterium]|nr:CoA-binding protein [Thermodesulfobacteriota bacterium]
MLDVFFHPKSIAIIVASGRVGSWGYLITRHIVEGGFQGNIYLVNLNAKELFGLKPYLSLKDVPGEVDLAVIVVPPGMVLEAMEECASSKVKGVVVITSGFGEVSEEGRRQEGLLVDIAKRGGIRLLGPNCSGLFDFSCRVNASGCDWMFLQDHPIAFVTQSGYSIENLGLEGYFNRLGFDKFVHTGNESDLTCTDFLEYFGHDSHTKVILLYLEGLKDGRRFAEVARDVSRKKPVVAFKAGRTTSGAKAMLSHTGSIAGSEQIIDMVLKETGIIRVEKLEGILKVGKAFLHHPPLKGDRIGILTIGGGWGVILSDALTQRGLRVLEFPTSIRKELISIGNIPPWASVKNPVDIGAAFGLVSHPVKTHKIVDFLLSVKEIDGLVVHGFGRLGVLGKKRPEYEPLAENELELLDQICELARHHSKPLLL